MRGASVRAYPLLDIMAMYWKRAGVVQWQYRSFPSFGRGFDSHRPLHKSRVRPGDIGDSSYRTHRLHFWAERVVERLQSFFLQIDVAEIVLHKADQPNPFFDFFDAHGLSGKAK